MLDTNVIIEAHRAKCWKALAHFFRFETVEQCCVEAATGDRRRTDYVAVEVDELGMLDRFVSLEASARSVGLAPQLKKHFTDRWLSLLRTHLLMGGSL